jgi:hypothetical protein
MTYRIAMAVRPNENDWKRILNTALRKRRGRRRLGPGGRGEEQQGDDGQTRPHGLPSAGSSRSAPRRRPRSGAPGW